MFNLNGKYVFLSIALVALLAMPGVLVKKSYASSTCKLEVASIVSTQGIIELRRAKAAIWQTADADTVVCAGDMVRARSHSRAALRLRNDSMLRLDQKTSIAFPDMPEEKGSWLMDMLEGAIHIITRTPKPFKTRTPFVNASVEGTEFSIEVQADSTEVVVYEGRVYVDNELGGVALNDHERAVAYKGQAPRKDIIIRPTDAVQWALYYPAISDNWVQEGAQESHALIQQADSLLTAGQVDEAKALIAQVLQQNPYSSNAHALLAVVAVAQNEKDQALELANRAVMQNPFSSAAYLALSYAQQAHFDIEAALDSAQKAVTLDARRALAWARLAELQMSLGELDRALDAARHAVNLTPGLARTQTILGFAHLLQMESQTTKEIFHRAVSLDQADPMPRLGLGIALIREGNLEAGRIELETAASLDPANSLIRSYLGKAYFEEKRYSLSGVQFDLAKERDPQDPTPWLYDAIQKQTQNRPIEALRDIQKSIELNNNRAVYRSKFLLDRDEAARGSSLARIFENLGFERRAVMETAKSLSFDPASHSAHRFLSDTYANIPRHEAARVSGLLQAQLLQPINVNPVQPHMAVADLNIITGTIPTAVGFNEFTPLMERNKSQVVASGIVGSNHTLGNEIVASKLYDKASISLGQFHYETNGFRPNNNLNSNIYNAFMQYSVTPKLNLQAELRTRDTSHGDIGLNFSHSGDLDYRRTLKENTARLGARYSISVNQDLLFSGKYIDRKVDIKGFDPGVLSGFQFETQHLFRQKNFNSVMGGGTYDFGGIYSRDNYYMYTNTHLPWNLIATLGFSYDAFVSVDNKNHDKLNPKFGLQWDITDNLRLRAAWFEATKAHLIAQQSLEPVQVAGFNQFYDDPNATRSRRMGIGVDYRISNQLYSGVEASERNFKIPYRIFGSDLENLSSRKEQSYRAYLYWIPHASWVVKGEFQFEQYNQVAAPISSDNLPQKLQTLSAPVSIEYFHSSGLFSKFSTTFVNQDLMRFNDRMSEQKRNPERTKSGVDSFLIADLMFGYRFPERRGMLGLEGRNLLDEHFFYQNTNFYASEPTTVGIFVPERMFFLKLTLNY